VSVFASSMETLSSSCGDMVVSDGNDGGVPIGRGAYVFDMFLLSLTECTLGCTVLFLTFLEAVLVLENSTGCQ
jgi:hypothetical protein